MANFRRDSVNTLLEKDAPLDLDVLDDERERITKMLREKGYFNFSKNFIQFLCEFYYGSWSFFCKCSDGADPGMGAGTL